MPPTKARHQLRERSSRSRLTARKERQTMLNSPFSVYVEEPARSLDESMNAIRSWLDHNKIQPIELNTTTRQAYRPLPLQHRHRSAQPLYARKPVAASGVAARGKQRYRRPPGARPLYVAA